MSNVEYTPTLHAIERAHHRLGVEPTNAQRWFNETMRKAKYLYSRKKQAYYDVEDVRLVVDTDTQTIVTIYPKFDTTMLKPIFDRERRRLRREVIREVRRHELEIAELTIRKGERMTAKARARNPQTREIIQRDIDVLQTMIDERAAAITRENDRLENFERATGVYV